MREVDRRTVLGRLAAAGAITAPAMAAAAAPAHPDAELLALGSELEAALRFYRDCPEAEDAAASARLEEIEDQIMAAVPATAAGLAVKLRLAWSFWVEDADPTTGGPSADADPRTHLLWALVEDAERLGGAQ